MHYRKHKHGDKGKDVYILRKQTITECDELATMEQLLTEEQAHKNAMK